MYVIQHIGTLPGDFRSDPLAINSGGRVVGISYGAARRAFSWKSGVMTDLHALVKLEDANVQWTQAHDINDHNDVVGTALFKGESRGFIYIFTTGKVHFLRPLDGNSGSWANGINEDGVVVGSSGSVPVLWKEPTNPNMNPKDLAATNPKKVLLDIGTGVRLNKNQTVVANTTGAGWDIIALVWRPNQVLQRLENDVSEATSVNDKDWIAGQKSGARATLWAGGKSIALAPIG